MADAGTTAKAGQVTVVPCRARGAWETSWSAVAASLSGCRDDTARTGRIWREQRKSIQADANTNPATHEGSWAREEWRQEDCRANISADWYRPGGGGASPAEL